MQVVTFREERLNIHPYHKGDNFIPKKGLSIMVGHKLSWSYLCGAVAKQKKHPTDIVWGYINRCTLYKVSEVLVPPCSVLIGPQWRLVYSSGAPHFKEVEKLRRDPKTRDKYDEVVRMQTVWGKVERTRYVSLEKEIRGGREQDSIFQTFGRLP